MFFTCKCPGLISFPHFNDFQRPVGAEFWERNTITCKASILSSFISSLAWDFLIQRRLFRYSHRLTFKNIALGRDQQFTVTNFSVTSSHWARLAGVGQTMDDLLSWVWVWSTRADGVCFRLWDLVYTQGESHSGCTAVEPVYTTVTLLSTLMSQRWQYASNVRSVVVTVLWQLCT